MRNSVYSVIAVVGGAPMATWLLARDPDEALSKAKAKLPPDGEIKYALRVCVATLSELHRNKLISVIDREDAIVFTRDALLHLVQIQNFINWELSETLQKVRDVVAKVQEHSEALEQYDDDSLT